MALRSLENVPPKSPERFRNHSKTVVSIQKKLYPVHDENQSLVSPQEIDYILSENLVPIPSPETQILILTEGLESNDWVKTCDSLNDARRLAVYHSTILLPLLEKVILVAVKAMKNPRSALCKTSIMASSDFFCAFRDALLESALSDAFDQLLLQLLLKSSQDKKFVCEEADKSLKTMVSFMTPLPLLSKLQTFAGHSNPKVRAKAAVFMSQCVSKMGWEEMQEYGIVGMLQMCANLLSDRLPEAREAARNMVILVFKGFRKENGEENRTSWEEFCHTNLSPAHAQYIIKIIIAS